MKNLQHPYDSPFNTLSEFPSDNTHDLIGRQGTWCWNLGRLTACDHISIEAAYSLLDHILAKHAIDDPTRENFELQFERGLTRENVPPDAPERAAAMIDHFLSIVKDFKPPAWVNRKGRDSHTKLYLACLILGYKGREFTFARYRIMSAFRFPSATTVQNFVYKAILKKFLIRTRKGHALESRHGIPDKFQLTTSYDQTLIPIIAGMEWKEYFFHECGWVAFRNEN